MNDHIEHACTYCGNLLHHADQCDKPWKNFHPLIRETSWRETPPPMNNTKIEGWYGSSQSPGECREVRCFHGQWYDEFGNKTDAPIKWRVLRKPLETPWLPIDQAPKDGSLIEAKANDSHILKISWRSEDDTKPPTWLSRDGFFVSPTHFRYLNSTKEEGTPEVPVSGATPRTDQEKAHVDSAADFYKTDRGAITEKWNFVVPADFARTLERELEAAVAENEQNTQQYAEILQETKSWYWNQLQEVTQSRDTLARKGELAKTMIEGMKDTLRQEPSIGALVTQLWDQPLKEAEETIAFLHTQLTQAKRERDERGWR